MQQFPTSSPLSATTPQPFEENLTMSNTQQPLPRDANDKDYYFRGLNLIPGFPFWEFRGAPQKVNDNADVDITPHHTVTHSFLDLIKNLPPEICTHIFAQIPQKRSAEDSDLDSGGCMKKNAYLMQDYSLRPDEILQCSPVKYAIRIAKDECSKSKQNVPDASDEQSLEAQKPILRDFRSINREFEKCFALVANNVFERCKERELSISYIENDHPVAFARSHVDFVRFASSLAHSEGFYFEDSPNLSAQGVWKSEIRESSLLREFLAWFWKHFVLDFTNQLETCSGWLKSIDGQFNCLQNINIDILASPYFGTHENVMKRSINGCQFKKFLKGLDNLPNIESLTVYIQMDSEYCLDLLQSPEAHTWVNALREVTFVKSFDLKTAVFVYARPTTIQKPSPDQKEESAKFRARYDKRLCQLLMPKILCYGTTDDVPDHLGLRQLFAMEEE
ncbi:hypothetical protein NHQ30_011588 [Ciborinia camelliae]|nr:hypothetical protein NHQ30_011588 [Ciborinia camelliae]